MFEIKSTASCILGIKVCKFIIQTRGNLESFAFFLLGKAFSPWFCFWQRKERLLGFLNREAENDTLIKFGFRKYLDFQEL